MELSDALCRLFDPHVTVAGFHAATPGWQMKPKRPIVPDFDLWYVVRGRGRVLLDGRWWAVKRGDLLLMRPGQSFQQEQADDEDPFHVYFVHFLPFGPGRPAEAESALAEWPTLMTLGYQPRLADLFGRLFDAFIVNEYLAALRLKAVMLELLEVLIGHLRRHPEPDLPPAFPRLQQACQFIRDNYAGKLSLEEIAASADLSGSYLLTLFRRHMGCSPIQYQIRLRLEAARSLLARGMSVSATARAVGFQSLHYFSRTFRSHTAMTATAYAEQCRFASRRETGSGATSGGGSSA